MRWGSKLASLAGMLMIGDALSYLLKPERHIEAWRSRSRLPRYNRMLDWCEDHQAACRAMSLVEVVAGIELVRRVEAGA